MPSWRKKALQSRSRKTEKALARAARELLSTQSYADITVGEVARKAGLSVGGYYARFQGKSALLHLADIDFLEDFLAAFDAVIPESFEGDLDALLRAFVNLMVRQFSIHRVTILQRMKHATEKDYAEFRERASAFNAHVHGRLRTIMSRNADEIAHPNPAIAINMTIFIASAAAREAVLTNRLEAYPIELNLDELIEELILNASRYLKGGAS